MKFKTEIDDLIYLSKTIGNQLDLIQGGGGNISVKLDNNIMAIKASGIFLKDLKYNSGISFVNFAAIKDFIHINLDKTHISINDFIKSQIISFEDWSIQRPSIETGFHVILDKYTIHSHSVYANLLCCSSEGKELSKKLFPDSAWIDYLPPGEDLTRIIAKINENKKTSIYFIENHGLISSSNDSSHALNMHIEINNLIKKAFIFDEYINFQPNCTLEFIRNNVLFPDQVVYTNEDHLASTPVGIETIKCYCYILSSISNNKLTPRFLNSSQVDFINNMESEKYRKGLIKS